MGGGGCQSCGSEIGAESGVGLGGDTSGVGRELVWGGGYLLFEAMEARKLA